MVLTVSQTDQARILKIPIPKYETLGSSGADLPAAICNPILIMPGERGLVPTGLKMEVPHGFEVQIRPRSGLALKKGVTVLNTPGTIDSDYRGEVGVILINHGKEVFIVNKGDRIAQMVLVKVEQPFIACVDYPLSDTDRGNGGFGSTGMIAEIN